MRVLIAWSLNPPKKELYPSVIMLFRWSSILKTSAAEIRNQAGFSFDKLRHGNTLTSTEHETSNELHYFNHTYTSRSVSHVNGVETANTAPIQL